jgi:signal transduction histidine kinase
MRFPSANRRPSIFVKLFVVLALTGILISLAIAVAFSSAIHPKFDPRFRRSMERYAEYLATDIGEPPDFAKGRELSRQFGIDFRAEGQGWEWATDPGLPRIADVPHEPHGGPGGMGPPPLSFMFHHGPPDRGPVNIVERQFASGPGKVLVSMHRRPVFETNYIVIFGVLGFLIAVLVMSYLSIRAILKPLTSLTKGVSEIAGGNFNHLVPIESSDELGRLARAFNSMVARIKEMLHSKQQLLIDVSHELRSPLTRAKMALELDGDPDSAKQVGQALDEIEAMIQELLEAARLDSNRALRIVPTDLAALTAELVERYAALDKPVEVTAGPRTLAADVDAERIRSVITNLIENALKYSKDKPVSLTLRQEDRFAVLEVRDRGVGISEADILKVFEPFYRVDKSRNRHTGGYGLGLSLCKRIVDAHQGRIDIKSQPDQGTTIRVALPMKFVHRSP